MVLKASVLSAFVYLSAIIPNIQESLLYSTPQNFTGSVLAGYEKKPRAILTRVAAEALKKAQAIFESMGYSLVIYDAYRPKRSVDAFLEWSQKKREDPQVKAWFYPMYEEKTHLFREGFIPAQSSHSRGSTFDGTLIALGRTVQSIKLEKRVLQDGREITYLNDGTLDMGTHFNYFGPASWTHSTLVTLEQQANRQLLKEVLESCGFVNLPQEWWHFTFQPEPYPDTYFDFIDLNKDE